MEKAKCGWTFNGSKRNRQWCPQFYSTTHEEGTTSTVYHWPWAQQSQWVRGTQVMGTHLCTTYRRVRDIMLVTVSAWFFTLWQWQSTVSGLAMSKHQELLLSETCYLPPTLPVICSPFPPQQSFISSVILLLNLEEGTVHTQGLFKPVLSNILNAATVDTTGSDSGQALKCSLNSILYGHCRAGRVGQTHHRSDSAGHVSLALQLQLRSSVTTLDGTAYRMKSIKLIWDSARGPGLPKNSYGCRVVSRIVIVNTHPSVLVWKIMIHFGAFLWICCGNSCRRQRSPCSTGCEHFKNS